MQFREIALCVISATNSRRTSKKKKSSKKGEMSTYTCYLSFAIFVQTTTRKKGLDDFEKATAHKRTHIRKVVVAAR